MDQWTQVPAGLDLTRVPPCRRRSRPPAGTFPLPGWRTALELSLSGQAHGKLLLLP
jgi:hypothetical protein